MEFNFNENAVVESLDKVPQDFRGLYVDSGDGKFKLNTDDGPVKSAVSAITGLNRALVAARAEAKAHKGKILDLTPLAEYGETPEAILENVNAKIEEIKKSSKGKGTEDLERQVTKIKEDLGKAHAATLEKEVKRSDALKGQLYRLLVSSAATNALVEAGAIDPDLAKPFLEQQVRVTEEDGEFQVTVVDEAGDPRFSGTTGTHMSIKELVAEMKGKEKFAPLFKSDSHRGGGTPPQQPRNRQGMVPPGTEKSSVDKIAAGLKARQK